MTSGIWRNYPRATGSKNSEITDTLSIYLPKKVHERLKVIAAETGRPIGRLVTIAVDNELETEKPFTFSTDCPDVPYVKHQYQGEAGKIYNFLLKFPAGLGLDFLTLVREEILGTLNKDLFFLALRELFASDMVEFYENTGKRGKKTEEKIRAKDDADRSVKRFKKLEGKNLKYVKRIRDSEIDRGDNEES